MYYKSVLLIDADIDDRDLFCITVQDISPEIHCKQFARVTDALPYLEKTETLPEIIFAEIDIYLSGGMEFWRESGAIKRQRTFLSIFIQLLL